MVYIGFSRNNRQETYQWSLLNLKGTMNIDSFENWNQCNRRELLTFISFFGVMGTIAFLLNGCRLSTGIRQITGEVLINGRRISPEQLEGPDGVLVPSDASISTGSAGSAVFVIGRDAFLIRGNSRLELKPNLLNGKQNEISGFDLKSGAILSVFVRKKRTLRTLTAVIGIRGTGVYLETDSEKTYVCTCYGTSHLQVKDVPEINETVTTLHHDQPRFIYSGEKRIDPAPVINHSDQELILLERLVGRVPPFVKQEKKNDGGKY